MPSAPSFEGFPGPYRKVHTLRASAGTEELGPPIPVEISSDAGVQCRQGSTKVRNDESWYRLFERAADHLKFVVIEPRLVLIGGSTRLLHFSGDFHFAGCLRR